MSAPVSNARQSATALVDNLLSSVRDTDAGNSVTAAQRAEIDDTIRALMEIGRAQTPMSDPRLFAKYTVAYTSTSDKSPPAGGLFRSRLGRVVFVTRGLFQHLFRPGIVVNLVCFRVLGVVSGCVTLRGMLEPIESDTLGPNAIKVVFERPRLRIGGLKFQFGPRSSVTLATTYVDERIRLAIGGRGSLFVFVKGGQAESKEADEWDELCQSETMPVVVLPLLLLGVLAVAWLAPWPARVISLAVAMIFVFVLRRGGVADNAPGALDDHE